MDLKEKIKRAVSEKKVFHRALTFDVGEREIAENDERTVPVSFSSEEPYSQWWGLEILSHEKGAMNLDKLRQGISPVLFNHDRDSQIGVVESAELKAKRGEAVLRFSRGAMADEIYQDILDNIRKQVSVGYTINEYRVENAEKPDERFIVTDWEPHEISIVTLAADTTIGVGRSDFFNSDYTPSDKTAGEGEDKMNEQERQEQLRALGVEYECPDDAEAAIADSTSVDEFMNGLLKRMAAIAQNVKTADDVAKPDGDDIDDSGTEPKGDNARGKVGDDDPPKALPASEPPTADIISSEDEVASQIFELGKKYHQQDLAQRAIVEKWDVQKFTNAVLDESTKLIEIGRGKFQIGDNTVEEVVYDPKDVRNFSIVKLFQRIKEPNAKGVEGGFELEMVQEERKRREKLNLDVEGTPIPHGLLNISGARDLTVGTDSAGGYTVDDELLSTMFIDHLLENTAATKRCTKLTGLVSDITIPRHKTRGTAEFTGETVAPTETNQAFDVVRMAPKHVRAYTIVSTTLLKQSSIDIEQFIRMDLSNALGTAMDVAILSGTGSNDQPTGIKNQTGITSQTYTGTPVYDTYLQAEEALADSNALQVQMSDIGWVAAPNIRTSARKTAELGTGTETPIWQDGRILDYSVDISTNVSDDEFVFGNWRDCLVGMWGGVDVVVDPFTLSTRGLVRVSIFQMMDFALRHPESMVSITK